MDSKQKPPKTSSLFNDADADITFKSSDDVLFKIHSKHLQTTSAVLSPGPASMDLGEIVLLPETSDVLQILFQFIRPPLEDSGYRQPSVVNMETDLFFRVAEAAEKYTVFSAINVCMTWMHHNVKEDSLRILNHCGKHGYTELSDIAAERSLQCSLTDAGRQLTHPGVLGKWLLHYEYWMRLRHVLEKEPVPSCPVLQLWRSEFLYALAKNPISFSRPPPRRTLIPCTSSDRGGFGISKINCFCGDDYPKRCAIKLSEQRNAIPKFSSITLVD